METRANYLLIGVFTVAGFIGLLGFFLWFARVELDRQFSYYDVFFSSVSGLTNASEVRFSGLPVGQVVDVALDPDGSGQVLVRVEVDAETPVRTSSLATIETLGVTGVSYVGISAGDPRDPLLAEVSEDPVPDIPSGRSALQSLSEDAPAILEEILQVTRNVSELFGTANQDRVRAILTNVEASSENLDRALADFSSVTESIAIAAEDVALFTRRFEDVPEAARSALEAAETTSRQVAQLARRAEASLDVGDATLESGRQTLDSARTFIEEDLVRLVEDLDQSLATLRSEIDEIGADASAMLDEVRRTGAVATERLQQVEETIVSANEVLADISDAMSAVDSAAARFDAFIADDGTAVVDEARRLMADANDVVNAALSVAENDLPGILEDIRSATETAARTVESVGRDLSTAAGRTDEISAEVSDTLRTVTGTFENANQTLARLNTALETGDAALTAAETAFTSADRVLNEEVGEIVDVLQATLARLDEAITSVSDDVPAITGELRQTAERANAAFAEVEGTAEAVGPSLRAFANDGLPQYSRLAREARDLVGNLQQLVRQIERDPARYFLGREAPEFRR